MDPMRLEIFIVVGNSLPKETPLAPKGANDGNPLENMDHPKDYAGWWLNQPI